MKSAYDFIESPLVVWAKSILNINKLEYDNFPNGEYFYLILKQSDPRLQNSNSDLPNEGEPYDTTRSRLLNLDFILRNIRSFYQEILNHILLIKLPDIYMIAKYPENEDTFKEMEKMLLLLLGLAINGEFKEKFIEQIQQSLETPRQIQLVPFIQLVTEDLSFSISKSLLLYIKNSSAESANNNNTKTEKLNLQTSITKLPSINVEISYDTTSNNNNNQHSPRENSAASTVSSHSSTTSFTQACQQIQLQQQAVAAYNNTSVSNNNQLVLHYQTVDQFNYFLNNKLMPNMQRIVDERDSYLESIIELEQDKDYLAFKLNNSQSQLNNTELNQSSNGTHIPITHEKYSDSSNDANLKNLTINELIINLVNNSSTICSITNSEQSNKSKIDPKTGLVDLNDTNMKLLRLIDSINKHDQEQASSSESYYQTMIGDVENNNKGLMIGENILNDLKSKKELASSWNQKIAIELVECKIRLKQLINEIEEKCECIESLKDEMDDVRKQYSKLRNENCDLQQKAALANVYSDELESLREKSVKVDRYECELAKLKERIDELQMNEPRLNELKEENHILIETRTFMEKQLEEYQQRLISTQRLDSDLNKYKQEVDDLTTQSTMDKKRMCELCEKNAKLDLEMKNLLNQNVNLDEELTFYKQKYTFTSAELVRQQQAAVNATKAVNSQHAQMIERGKLKLSEQEQLLKEMNMSLKFKDQELGRMKENARTREIRNDECMAKLKALDDQLNIEQVGKMKLEKVLDQHKTEIKELQTKLDDCVNETKKLDHSIRAAARSNEIKTTANEENFNKLVESHDQLNQSYKTLLNDHEQLQKLYLQLESDYDDLYSELTKKHSIINGMNGDFDELNMKYTASLDMIDNLEKSLEKFMAKENVSVGTETEKLGDTEALVKEAYEEKFKILNTEINDLTEKRNESEVKLKEMTLNLGQVSEENSCLKDDQAKLNGEIEKHQEANQMQFIQCNQLSGKMQTMEILNEKLEDEKAQLFEQLHMLLQQNQEILTQTLTNKDLYHEETKAYLQQLHKLNRQKESLEQKIMEQYKNCPTLNQKTQKKSQNPIRHLMQKVTRAKSNPSHSTDLSIDQNISSTYNEEADTSDLNIYENDNFLNRSSSKSSFCHKYSADDIQYLNIQATLDKELNSSKSQNLQQNVASTNTNSNRNTVSSLSSSSSTSSSSSASSSSSSASSIPQINYESVNQIITNTTTPQKQPSSNNNNNNTNKTITSSSFIMNQLTTPIKYDPKSLKLGGRPQSICSSSVCSSPQSHLNSPSNASSVQKKQNEYKRVMIGSSPMYQNKNVQIHSHQNLNEQQHSSSSSSSPSSVSSSSLTCKHHHQLTPTKSSTPIKSHQIHHLTQMRSAKSSPMAKKCLDHALSNSNTSSGSSLLISSKSQQKITQRIAHELSKFRMSTQLGENDDEIETTTSHNNPQAENDDCMSTTSGLVNKNSNEIWLEYGCI